MKSLFVPLAFSLLTAPVVFGQTTFQLTSFDPPASLETHSFDLNDSGAIVGYYLNTMSQYVGYERRANGTYTGPIQISTDNTYTVGINDSGTIVGYYYPPTSAEQTFLLNKGKFTLFNYPGSTQTQIDKINKNGDLTGIYIENSSLYPGFLYLASSNTYISFAVPGAAATFGQGLNKADTVVGDYTTTIPYGPFHGFIRSGATGNITTYDFPGSTQTNFTDINDCGVIVGSYFDSANIFHGFYGKFGHFFTFDYPSGSNTYIGGINFKGEITGRYLDSITGFSHGFFGVPTSPGTSCK